MQNSYWINNATTLQLPTLEKDMHSDIVIVGGGITGILLGYYLLQAKQSFVIVEANEIGSGASGRNTGKITAQHSLVYDYLLNHFSKEVATLYYEACESAIQSMEEIIRDNSIECGFKRIDSVVYTSKEEDIQAIEDEYKAYKQLGIPCTYLDKTSSSIPFLRGIAMPFQAQYNPLAFLQGVCNILLKNNINIYEHTPIKDIQKTEDGYCLQNDKHTIHAKKVILATQFPFMDATQLYFSKLYNEQSSIYCSAVDFTLDKQYISTGDDVVSYRTIEEESTTHLLFGGLHHAVGREKPNDTFLPYHQALFNLKGKVTHWSSQDYYTADRLPLVGPLQKEDTSILFASGYQKWGNTLGCVSAKLLCSIILDEPSPYRVLFDPHRSGLLMNATAMKENAKVAFSYIKSKMQNPTNMYPEKGHASLIEWDDEIYGVYKDENDKVHIVNTKCPHLGCQCVFNEVDKTWDCPCHGSRFSYTGEVIKGPSTYALASFEEEDSIHPHLLFKE